MSTSVSPPNLGFRNALEEHLRQALVNALPDLNLEPQDILQIPKWASEWGEPRPMSVERVVRPEGRPAIPIRNGEPVLSVGNLWQQPVQEATPKIERAIAGVGRIEATDDPLGIRTVVGTGWMIHEDIVVTNRHVASRFALKTRPHLFKTSSDDFTTPLRVTIDFQEEPGHGAINTQTFLVERVLDILPDDGPDLAFLRVKSSFQGQPLLPLPIRLSGNSNALAPGSVIAVIGYPAQPRGASLEEQKVNDAVFQSYGVKTISPGEIIEVNDDGTFTHDCSTLEGNSGSVIVDLNSGEAIGIHYHGTFLTGNTAVSFAVIREHLNALAPQNLA